MGLSKALRAAIRAELEDIRSKSGGVIHPKSVVNRARPEDSPLHSQFCWNDGKAAEEYRVWQARQLIASVKIAWTRNPEGDRVVSVRAYYNQDDERGGDRGYLALVDILSDATRRKKLLRKAADELLRFEQEYHELEELAELFKVTKALRQSLRDQLLGEVE
jgi:hypothetical protein